MSATMTHPIDLPLAVLARGPRPIVKAAARILFISSHPSTMPCASELASSLQLDVELASNRRAGLAALRRGEYSLILVEEGVAAADPGGCDLLWQNAGLALPLEIDLSHTTRQRVLRDVRAALTRRHRELALARRAAITTLEGELKSSLAGLLLQTELALREPTVSATLMPRLRNLVTLAGDLRKHLQPAL